MRHNHINSGPWRSLTSLQVDAVHFRRKLHGAVGRDGSAGGGAVGHDLDAHGGRRRIHVAPLEAKVLDNSVLDRWFGERGRDLEQFAWFVLLVLRVVRMVVRRLFRAFFAARLAREDRVRALHDGVRALELRRLLPVHDVDRVDQLQNATGEVSWTEWGLSRGARRVGC